jgi:hypothetical protein
MCVSSGNNPGGEGGKSLSLNSYPSGDVFISHPHRILVAAEVPLY